MNTLNHAAWGATIGRTVGMPVEGAVIATIPDLLTVPLFGYFQFKHKMPPEKAPKWLLSEYAFLHNWIFGAVICGVLYLISPRLSVLGLAYFWHIVEDAFVHTKMATQFLWPIWKGKVAVYSAAEHKWVQVVDLVLLALVNIAISYLHR